MNATQEKEIETVKRHNNAGRGCIGGRLALVADSVCVLRYDNEAGKGDHRHIGRVEKLYKFVDPETLLVDFWNDVEAWRR